MTHRTLTLFAAMALLPMSLPATAQTQTSMEPPMTTSTHLNLTDVAARNEAIVEDFFNALEALDVEAFGALMTEEAIYYNPMWIGSEIFTSPQEAGRDQIVSLFRIMPEVLSEVKITDREYDQAADPNKMFVRTATAFTFRKDGYVYRNDILHVFEFEDGKVSSWTEFMDTVSRDKAYGRPGIFGEEQ